MQKLVNTLVLVFFTCLIFVSCKKDAAKEPTWLKQDLLAYYPFNGNARDSSGNGYDGEVNGAVLTTDRKGVANGSYSFPNNGFVSVKLNETHFLGNFTISLWGKVDNTTNFNPMLVSSSYLTLIYSVPNNKAEFYFRIPSAMGAYMGNANVQEWNHIAVMVRNDTTRMYINGVYQGNTPLPKPRPSVVPGSSMVFGRDVIGMNPQYYNLQGKLDEIRIYKRALTDDEVKYLYQN